MSATALVIGTLGLCTALWCLKTAIGAALWSRRRSAIIAARFGAMGPWQDGSTADVAGLNERTANLRQATERLKTSNDVKEAVLEKIRSGDEVSDWDIADLVAATGAPVDVVFSALDEMSETWHKNH